MATVYTIVCLVVTKREEQLEDELGVVEGQ